MDKKLANSTSYHLTNLEGAEQAVKDGKLVVFSFEETPHGHVGTFSVGENVNKGQIANIGRHNGFKPIVSTPGNPGGVFSAKSFPKVNIYVEGSRINFGQNNFPELTHPYPENN